MKANILILIVLLFSLKATSQNEEIFKMKKAESSRIQIDKKYASDAHIDLTNQKVLTSLSITGNIKLQEGRSLVRVILVTKAHEYLVYEAYPLLTNSLNFSIDQKCEETALLNNEEPVELILIVRNAELDLKQICFSNIDLSDNEKNNFSKLTQDFKGQFEKYKAAKINYQIAQSKNNTWLAAATELATLPFEKKKSFLGGNYDFISEGYEYYSEGIFSFESDHPEKTNLKSAATTTYPSSFDWRNRHGQNWMTPIRLQGWNCGACTAFANIAVLEIMTNLYFNRHINVDLSEQELVSCIPIPCDRGASESSVFAYLNSHPVCNDDCFPYSASNESCTSPNKCTTPTERIGFTGRYLNGISESTIKEMLIFKGPLVSGFNLGDSNHSMALVGYNVIQAGDTIKRWSNNQWTDSLIIQPNDPLIGTTYWIFKDSYSSIHSGYQYIIIQNVALNLEIAGAIITPITSLNYSENDRVCIDNDGDGYYNWGIGTKPSTCPLCSTNQEDGDDSNPNLGPLDAYGNCTPISSPYPYSQHLITSTETWQSTYSECGNVIVKNGGNLTINGATVNLEGNATFSVEVGGVLTFSSGTIQ